MAVTIELTVKDKSTSKTITGATISTAGLSAKTDNKGIAKLDVKKAGTYKVEVSKAGYVASTITTTLKAGEYMKRSVYMTPGTAAPEPVKPITPTPAPAPAPGGLVEFRIESEPSGAKALVSFMWSYKTPASGKLPAMTYPVTLTLDGYQPYTFMMSLKAGTSFYKKVTLARKAEPITKTYTVAQYETSNDMQVADWLVKKGFANKTATKQSSYKDLLGYATVFVCGGQGVNPIYKQLIPYGFPELTESNKKPLLPNGYITVEGTRFVPCAGLDKYDTVYVTANNVKKAEPSKFRGDPAAGASYFLGLFETGQYLAVSSGNIDDALEHQYWVEAMPASDRAALNVLATVGAAVDLLPLAYRAAVWAAGKGAPTLVEAANRVKNAQVLASTKGGARMGLGIPAAADDAIKALGKSADDLSRSLSTSDDYAKITAKLNDWVTRTDKSMEALEEATKGLSAADKALVIEQAATKINQGRQTLSGLMASKAIAEQLPKVAWYKAFPRSVADFLWKHKVAIPVSAASLTMAYIGGTSLGGFLLEEVLQSAEFGVSFALTIYRDKAFIGNAEIEGVITDAINNYESVLNEAKGTQILLRTGQVLAGPAVDLYIKNARTKLDQYKREFELLKSRKAEVEPSQYKVIIDFLPTSATVTIDGRPIDTYGKQVVAVPTTIGAHTLVVSKEPDYATFTWPFMVSPFGTTNIPKIVLKKLPEEEKKYGIQPIRDYGPPTAPGEQEDYGELMITSAPGEVMISTPGQELGVTDSTGRLSVDLLAGSYEITFSKSGYQSETRTAIVKAGQSVVLTESIDPLVTPISPPSEKPWAWRYDIVSTPAQAKILIDGAFQDAWTPDYVILLPNTQYTISVEKSGYYPAEVTVLTDPL